MAKPARISAKESARILRTLGLPVPRGQRLLPSGSDPSLAGVSGGNAGHLIPGKQPGVRCEIAQNALLLYRGIFMRIKFMRTAIVAGTAAVAGLATASPAMAAPIPTVQVPCRVSALASAISGASNGAVLRLASCTYLLTSALPAITHRLTLQGAAATTIERRYGGATPHFSLLSVGTGGNLTVTNVNFKNG